jgi:hypothetical protein
MAIITGDIGLLSNPNILSPTRSANQRLSHVNNAAVNMPGNKVGVLRMGTPKKVFPHVDSFGFMSLFGILIYVVDYHLHRLGLSWFDRQ